MIPGIKSFLKARLNLLAGQWHVNANWPQELNMAQDIHRQNPHTPPLQRGAWRDFRFGVKQGGIALILLAVLGLACGPSAGPETRLPVVATTSILGDMAKNVGGNLVEVQVLIPPGTDVHSYQSRPEDSIAISKARLIVSNGRGLDAFLDATLASTRQASAIHVVASQGLEALPVMELEIPSASGTEEGQERHEEPEHLEGDPHHWQDPLQAIHYVEQIRHGLSQADPANASLYQANAAAYIQQLRQLDSEIAGILEQVPPQRRHLVTFHDAFGHFGRRYGWQVSAFVPHSAGDVTPESIVHILDIIKPDNVPAIFTEPQYLQKAVEQTARDAGVKVGAIYSDTLDSRVPTYIDMMRFNARSLADNLR